MVNNKKKYFFALILPPLVHYFSCFMLISVCKLSALTVFQTKYSMVKLSTNVYTRITCSVYKNHYITLATASSIIC